MAKRHAKMEKSTKKPEVDKDVYRTLDPDEDSPEDHLDGLLQQYRSLVDDPGEDW